MDEQLQPIQIKITTSGTNEAVKNINSVTNALKQLQDIAKSVANMNIGKINIKNINDNSTNFISKEDNRNITQFIDKSKTTNNILSKIGKTTKNVSNNVKGITRYFAKLGITFLSINQASKLLRQAMDESASWVENLNVMEVAFGNMSESAYKFAKTAAQGLGLNENQLLEYVSLFQQMASAMGQSTETAYQMSTALTLLGTDVASLYNKDVRVTMEALRSAIAGQVKPVRQFGFDITSYSIDALIEEMGILSGYTSRMMTQSQKQLARTILLIEQSRNAWGDLGKTINTYSNQQKILQSQLVNLKRAFGDLFVGVEGNWGIATQILYRINGVIMAIVETIRAFIPEASSSGFNELAEDAEDANNSMEDLEETLNGSLASFDKFNTLSQGDSKGNEYITKMLEDKLAEEYSNYIAEWNSRMEKVESTAHEIRDTIMEWLGFVKQVSTYTKLIKDYDDDTKDIYAEYTEVNWELAEGQTRIKSIRDFVVEVANVVKTIAIAIKNVISKFLNNNAFRENIRELLKTIQRVINLLFDADKTVLPHIIDKILELVNSLLPSINYLANVIIDVIEQLFSNKELGKLFDNIINLASTVLPMIINQLIPIVRLVGSVINLLANILLPIINAFLDAFNEISKWVDSWLTPFLDKFLYYVSEIVNEISKFISKLFELSSFGSTYEKGLFANGGYPDRGQMFIANENGAELVGNIGGRTAVANNDMIVQAIENASYQGMMRAVTSSGTNNITLKIDANSNDLSRALAKSMAMEFQRQGYSLKG